MGTKGMVGVLALDIAGGQIASISTIVHPDKPTHFRHSVDVRALLSSAR